MFSSGLCLFKLYIGLTSAQTFPGFKDRHLLTLNHESCPAATP